MSLERIAGLFLGVILVFSSFELKAGNYVLLASVDSFDEVKDGEVKIDSVAQRLPVLPFPRMACAWAKQMSYRSLAGFKSVGLDAGQKARLQEHWQSYQGELKADSIGDMGIIELAFLNDLPLLDTAFYNKSIIYRDSIGQQGYLLSARSGKVSIVANSETGLFYGLQTLRQLARAGWSQELFIADWPDYDTRVIFDDISRGPISTVDYIKKQIERTAELKINYFSFYIEHVVEPLSHPDFAPKDGKLTIAQIKELSSYAEKFHMKLIGSFQSFGHFEKILSLPQYKSMGETASLISPLDPKAKQFLQDVIGELADAFNGPWFNVNCDETFDLNKGKSKPYIDSIGADRFYADHLGFLYKILKQHNKKMMLWADVAMQYETIIQMLPRDVIYLTWEYGDAKSYEPWIKPFASRGLEFMVCPGILNSYRMFPDMLMAKGNIGGFLKEGKSKGATGAFTTVWDDGGSYLFSADWYGVYTAAEKSWNLSAAGGASFDDRYSKTAYGSENDNYVRSLFKLLELRGLPLTYNMNDVLWQQQLLPQEGQPLWLNNTWVLPAKKILSQAAKLLADAQPKFNFEDIAALRHTINQYTLMMDSRLLLAAVAKDYALAVSLQSKKPKESQRLIRQSVITVRELTERYILLKERFKKSWLEQNQSYWLDVVGGSYDVKINTLSGLQDALLKLTESSTEKKQLPAADQMGLQILQTTHTFFTYWLLSGPFPSAEHGQVPTFLYSQNQEYNKAPIPGAIATYNQRSYRWHKFASNSGGVIDLKNYFGKTSPAVAYAYCTLNLTAGDVNEVFVRAVTGTQVFCDGSKIATIQSATAPGSEQRISVVLSKGLHSFLLKVPTDKAAPWQFTMRLGDDHQVVNTKHKYQTNSKNKIYEVE